MKMKRFFLCAILAASLLGFQPLGNTNVENIRAIENTIGSVAEKACPAVVVVKIKKKIPAIQRGNPWEFFFDSPYGNGSRKRFRQQEDSAPSVEGQGSGFIVHEDGYIITNNHVIDGNNEIYVRLNDKSEFKADVKGSDPKTDIAVLKIDAGRKLPVLEFADSDKVKVGQFCIAIGAPFMFDYTTTFGIVSQKGRTVGLNVYENYIQTDAAINMGNSGGPLLNMDGKLIGVNDFIVSGNSFSPGNIGLGFAIPSNMVKDVYGQILSGGEVVRPWVGIAMEELSPEMKKQWKTDTGVLVREIHEGNPADKAGMEPGDIIVEVDGKKMSTPRDVQFAVLLHKPGDKIKFTTLRDGKKTDISVVAEKQDSERLELAGNTGKSNLGIAFGDENGDVIISEVKDDSPAASAGIEPGLKVLSVNRQKVKSAAEARKTLEKNPDGVLLILSDGNSRRIYSIQK